VARRRALAVPRLYHSTAMLLKDGRVLGGRRRRTGPIVGNSAQIYTPDYLARANGVRPSVLTGPQRVALGRNFRITTDRPITRMTLVKVGMATHGYNLDQRFFEASSGPWLAATRHLPQRRRQCHAGPVHAVCV
jgi:hypothetical protein